MFGRALRTAAVFVEEALWIRSVLERAPLAPGSTVLDVGSSTLAFRTEVQPHIDEHVFRPLRERELRIQHLDARAEPGVDIVADVTLEGVEGSYDLVICTNLLEHVVDRALVVANLKRLVTPGGFLLLTAPRRYPIHHDPIDTGFRPTTRRLVDLVGFSPVVEVRTLTVRSSAYYRGKRWYRRYLWPWQQACVLLQHGS